MFTLFLSLSLPWFVIAEDHGGGHEAPAAEADHNAPAEEPAAPLVDKYAGMKKFEMGETGSDVKIPTKIWEMTQGTKADQTFTFAPVKVRFLEKTKGTLIEPEFVVELPRGGGEIDLSKFVRDQQGTFKIFFDIDEIKEGKELQIFFVSKAKKRKLDGETWGAGCRKFMDVKNFVLSDKGIEVNTTRNRHLSVIGGVFFFSAGKQVTQVNFKDSTQANLFCDEGAE